MVKNMGTADRVIRSLVAVGIGVLYFTGRIGGTLAIVLGAWRWSAKNSPGSRPCRFSLLAGVWP